jgi:hypothetical protein
MLSVFAIVAALIIPRRLDETPAFQVEAARGEVPRSPIVQAVRESGSNMLRVASMALMNTIPTTVTVFGATFATSEAHLCHRVPSPNHRVLRRRNERPPRRESPQLRRVRQEPSPG